MQAILHGIQKVDFVNDQGERIQGTKLFLSYRDEKVVGQKTDKLFLKAGYQLPQGLALVLSSICHLTSASTWTKFRSSHPRPRSNHPERPAPVPTTGLATPPNNVEGDYKCNQNC